MLIRGIRGQPNRHEFHEISRNDLLTVAPKKNRLALLIAPALRDVLTAAEHFHSHQGGSKLPPSKRRRGV